MSRATSSVPTSAVAVVVAAAMLFGTAGTARELGPDDASSLSVGAVRIAIGAAVLWFVVATTERRGAPAERFRLVGRDRMLLAVGGLGVVAYTPLFFVAVDRTGVAVGTIVTIASGPFVAGAIEAIAGRHPPDRDWLIGTVVSVVGATVLVAAGGGDGAGIDGLGVLAALGAGCGYAVYSVSSKATMERGLSSTRALALPFTIGACGVVALSVGESFSWMGTWSGLAMGVYLGVAATGVAYVLFGFGLRRLAPSSAVTLVLVEPVTAAVLAVVVLNESIPPLGWGGAVLVLVGLGLVGRGARAETAGDPNAPTTSVRSTGA